MRLWNPAAIRPGRFDKIINFNELDSESIVKGLTIHLGKRKLNESQVGRVNWDSVLSFLNTGCLSGSDIPEVINRVIENKIDEHKGNVQKYFPNMDRLCEPDRDELFSNIKYFPKPIATKDITSTISTYLSF